jgi:glycosyltransferase involved in cell wall biosynthesis
MLEALRAARVRAASLSRTLFPRWRQVERSPLSNTLILQSKQTKKQTVADLERLLWGGHAPYALKELEAAKSRGSETQESGNAAWVLARWYASIGDYRRALDELSLAKRALGQHWNCPHWLVEILVRVELGRSREAETILEEALSALGEVPELCLLAANVVGAGAVAVADPATLDRHRLMWINKSFVAAGLATLTLIDPSRRLALDNLSTTAVLKHPEAGRAKVSVIMPAYNAAETLPFALKSVLAQSWENLEVLVIDDASTDNTWSVIQSFSVADARVKPLRHDENRGAYAARNTGLHHATGEFVTINDADDWSHPEKFAVQAADLLDTRSRLNTTKSARIHPDLTVRVKLPRANALYESIGSLMPRRTDINAIGGWDEPRFNADDELYDRFRMAYGANRRVLYPEVPLTLQLVRSDSLTACETTGIPTVKYGARRQYREAGRYWLELEMNKAEPRAVMCQSKRPFPIPAICKTKRTDRLRYDILYVADFSQSGENAMFNAHLLKAGHSIGLRQAWFHWPTVNAVNLFVDKGIRSHFHENLADCIVAGENLDCDHVLLYDPSILIEVPDPLPNISTRSCILIANRAAVTMYNKVRTVYGLDYEIGQAIHTAQSLFGVEPILAPVSPIVRNSLRATIAPDRLTKPDWMPLTDASGGSTSPQGDRLPIVGGYCGFKKWRPEALQEVFCADRACEVRILGDIKAAKAALPSNWMLVPHETVELREFLSALDICVCYPRSDASGMIDLVPIEAMALGIPVILPPRLRSVYGGAAVYAKPPDVFDAISALWGSATGYERQVERGLRFIRRNCSYGKFSERLEACLNRSTLRPHSRSRIWRVFRWPSRKWAQA